MVKYTPYSQPGEVPEPTLPIDADLAALNLVELAQALAEQNRPKLSSSHIALYKNNAHAVSLINGDDKKHDLFAAGFLSSLRRLLQDDSRTGRDRRRAWLDQQSNIHATLIANAGLKGLAKLLNNNSGPAQTLAHARLVVNDISAVIEALGDGKSTESGYGLVQNDYLHAIAGLGITEQAHRNFERTIVKELRAHFQNNPQTLAVWTQNKAFIQSELRSKDLDRIAELLDAKALNLKPPPAAREPRESWGLTLKKGKLTPVPVTPNR